MVKHVDVVPAVPVRLARVVDRLGQRILLDAVAVLVADVARDDHDLLAPVGAADALGALVECSEHVVAKALKVGVEPAAHLQHEDGVRVDRG
eukprot:scaffold89500_cov57-Phaeocystis_antarctica.AAC.5